MSLQSSAFQTTNVSFGDIVDAAANREHWATTELFRTVVPSLQSFLRNRGVEDSEDLANWVFYEAIRNLEPRRAQSVGQFHSYVHTIASRRLTDDLRGRSCRPKRASGLSYEHVVNTRSDQAAPFESAVDDRAIVDGLMTKLNADQRNVIRLRFLEDNSVAETARLLGKNQSAVKQLQHRALASLRAIAALIVVLFLALTARGLGQDNMPDELPVISNGGVEEMPARPVPGGVPTGRSGAIETRVENGQAPPVAAVEAPTWSSALGRATFPETQPTPPALPVEPAAVTDLSAADAVQDDPPATEPVSPNSEELLVSQTTRLEAEPQLSGRAIGAGTDADVGAAPLQLAEQADGTERAAAELLASRAFDEQARALDEQARALDEAFDEQDRAFDEQARALDEAFDEQDRALDEQARALDEAFDEQARALDEAFDEQARALDEALDEQARALDEALDVPVP